MRLRRVVPALLLLVVSLALAAPAMADVRVRIVRLSYLDGDVQIDRRDGQGFEDAMTNMPVVQGTRLWAREGGLAEVELEDGSSIRLTPHTLLEAQELALRGGRTVNLFDMQEGTAYFNLHGDDDDNFVLTLPGHQLRLQKGSHFRVTAERSQLRVSVFKGEVELSGAAVNRVLVKKGESISLDPFEDGRYFLSRDIRSEYYDAWDNEREEYRDTYARNSSYNGYSDTYRYGAHDLHYWGNYSYAPGWGWVWRPYYVGAAWNPWMDGAWVWYPGWGYTWVSAYPWGWMPYHFGSWVHIPRHGWCWRPGGWSWRHNTVAHHAPRGFISPRVPHAGSGAVIVVGKGSKTLYPAGDRGVLGTMRAAKEAANGSRSLAPSKGGDDANGSQSLMPSKGAGDSRATGVTKTHDGLGGGRKSEATGARSGGDARGGRTEVRETGASAWTPRNGRTVMDSRGEGDTSPDRQNETRGRRSTSSGSEGSSAWTGGRTSEAGGASSGGRSADPGSGSSDRTGDSSAGRSSGGRQETAPPARVSPAPAPSRREASPPPPRSAPAREGSRSTPTRGMSFDGGRGSGGGSRASMARSGGSGMGSSRPSGGSGGRVTSGRSWRSPR